MSNKARPLSVEEKVQRISGDCTIIKERIGMLSPILRKEHLPGIERESREVLKIKIKPDSFRIGAPYFYTEVMHFFHKDHIATKLRNLPGITPEEEQELRASMGRINYNPPVAEYLKRSEAYRRLAGMGQRGELILASFRAEFKELYRMHEGLSSFSGDFFNAPLNNIVFPDDEDFAVQADFYKRMYESGV